ncbi:MAG: magnesium transporter [Clostridiales bacterium]|nr:magnesium transporter [Clostridiales bacterium]
MSAVKPNYEREITNIIRSNLSPRVMREKLEDYHENDIGEVLCDLSVAERKKLYRVMDVPMLSGILEHMDEEDAAVYLDEMDIRKAVPVISDMEPDTAVDLLRSLSGEKRELLLDLMDDDSARDIRLIASYNDDEIGSKMSTNYIRIHRDSSVKEAMNSLIAQAPENDNISTLFVVDNGGGYYGALDLKELIIARQGSSLEDLIMTSFPYVYGHERVDDCIEKLKDYSEDSIPVLDNNNRILGVITSQNLLEVVDEEMGEDYAKLAGLTAEEDLSEKLTASMKKRLPWLIILLALGLVVSSVVSAFEQVVSQLPLIMAFQSLILDMAGNAGTQSLAVTIRVLMDENLTAGQKAHLVFKETRVGLCDGIFLGVLSFVAVTGFLVAAKGRTLLFALSVSGCIGISLMIAMLVSSAVGTLIPMFFKKIHIDPAVASGPLITTVNDLVAVVTYYGMSWLLLIQVLQLAG